MKKRLLSIILAVMMAVGTVPLGAFSAFAEDPSEDDVYIIPKLVALIQFANAINEGRLKTLGKTFILTGDIGSEPDEDETSWDSSKFTLSIGTSEHPFQGTFEGNGHTIWLNNQNGLFGFTEYATIQNVVTAGRVVNTSDDCIAGIVQNAAFTLIADCENRAALSGSECGGIAGHAYSSSLIGCVNRGDITGTVAGGIVAYSTVRSVETDTYTEVKNCLNLGNITAVSKAGGIAAQVSGCHLENCSSVADLKATDEAAGSVAGIAESFSGGSSMANVFTGGSVSGATAVSLVAHDSGNERYDDLYTGMDETPAGLGLQSTAVDTLEDAASQLNDAVFIHPDWYFWLVKTPEYSGKELRLVKPFPGDGTENCPYLIENADQLKWFADLVNGTDRQYANKFVKLAADIGSEEDPFTVSIGKPESAFCGTFDGAGHTVYLQIDAGSDAGLFGHAENATIKNIVTDGTVESNCFTAGIVGSAYDTVLSGCINNADVFSRGKAGGITAYAYNTEISGCENNGNISGDDCAGIAASFGAESRQGAVYGIVNCINRGEINAETSYGAGISAFVDLFANLEIFNCANTGTVWAKGMDGDRETCAGGICAMTKVGYNGKLSFSNCFSRGDLMAQNIGLLVASVSLVDGGTYEYTDISALRSDTKVIGTEETAGECARWDNIYYAADRLNRNAREHDDWYLWKVEDEELCFQICRHKNCDTMYTWNETYTECAAWARCVDCGEEFSETVDTDGSMYFIYDTPGTCQAHCMGHWQADFYNADIFEDQDAPANTAESEYFGYHVDDDRDGVCDLCKSTDLTQSGALVWDRSGKLCFEIVDSEHRTLRLISDTLIPIVMDGETVFSPENTSLKTKYSGKITVPATVNYAGKTYTVTEIGAASELDYFKSPFAGCTELTSVILPDMVRTIGVGAFDECSALTEITISQNVETVCPYAFNNCTNLVTAEFLSETAPNVPDFGMGNANVFHGCTALENIYVPAGSVAAYKSALSECADLIKSIDEKTYFPAVEPDCIHFGFKEYFKNPADGNYYEDAEYLRPIGDATALEKWLTEWSENCGIVLPLGHLGVPCEDVTDGHYCLREGCPYAGEELMHTFNEDCTACAECGAPCAKGCDHNPTCSDFYAFYNEFPNDGSPLTKIWYYINEDVTLTEPLVIAGEDVRFLIADNVTFHAAAGYYVKNGGNFDLYYQSRGENAGTFEGALCKCFDETESRAYPEHCDANTDGICDHCEKAVTKYLDENGSAAYIDTERLSIISSETTELESGWYLADYTGKNKGATFSERLVIKGDVHIILLDSSSIYSRSGITVNKGNTLSFYSQSLGDNMGAFETNHTSKNIYNGSAGIGGSLNSPDAGTIRFYGGAFKIYAGSGAAAIGGGLDGDGADVTVYHGEIYAEGSVGAAGIGGGFCGNGVAFRMYGGKANAIAGNGAVAGREGAGIGGGYNGISGIIEIGEAVTSVTATGGRALGSGIGAAQESGNISLAKGLSIRAGQSDENSARVKQTENEGFCFVMPTMVGDLNVDTQVNAVDLTGLKSALLQNAENETVLDTNGDGVFDVRDLIRMKKHLLDKTVPLGTVRS